VIVQPFVQTLGQGYLFNNVYLVYQIIAAQKNAIVVLPVNNFGDWDPFLGKDALYRCLKEISHYLHKYSLLTSYYRDMLEGTVDLIKFQKPIPSIGHIIVGAFSEGYKRLRLLFQNPKNSFNEKEFDKQWKEIWDVDCAINLYGGFEQFLNNLKSWYKPGRRFRLFHSQTTAGSWRTKSLDDLFGKGVYNPPNGKPVRGKIEKTTRISEVIAEENHHPGGDWSGIYFSDGYIDPEKIHDTKARPEFTDAHHFVPKIGVGYSASKSIFN
jgi:hypothetical protein